MSNPAPSEPISHDALIDPAQQLLDAAQKAGADKADVMATHGRSLGISVRGGAIEDVDSSEGKDIGLRVFIGQRQACVSSSDLSPESLTRLAERAVAMARLAPKDPFADLSEPANREIAPAELSIYDSATLSPEALVDTAREIEAAGLSVAGVRQCEGAGASATSSALFYATSDGYGQGYRTSRFSRSVSAIAQKDGQMERDYDYDTTRFLSDLRSAKEIGEKAGQRATARLGAKQIPSGTLPVMFDRRVSGAMLNALTGAIAGTAIARGTSFLKDKMGEQIFAPGVNVIDDPARPRGQGSRPFDGEGVKARKTLLIENGILKNWLLNTATAKQLGLSTTGHAYRGVGAPPSVSTSNLYIEAGKQSPEELLAAQGRALLVTEMFGPSLNNNTGDYSVGVSGYLYDNGMRLHPVSEITVAGNLLEIYARLIAANDLVFDRATTAPSLLLGPMAIAGA